MTVTTAFSFAVAATVLAWPAVGQPAMFDAAAETSCILDWFLISPWQDISALARAYDEATPVRLAAVLTVCSASAGSTEPPCDQACGAIQQVKAIMVARQGEKPVAEFGRLRW